MHLSSLICCLTVCASCTFRAPVPKTLRLQVEAEVHLAVRPAPPAPPPPPPVALVGARVVEFFGVPLEGAEDIVFILDSSGSMSEPAQGRIAQLPVAPAQIEPPMPPPDATAPLEGPPGPLPPGPPPPYPPDSAADAEPLRPESPQGTAAARRPRKIDVAQSELVDAISRLPVGTRLNVLFFNRELQAFAPDLFSLEESLRGELIQFVDATAPNGPTALAPAMRTAFVMNARRIVLLSDGIGNIGGGAASVLRDAHEGIRGGVRIDTIGLGSHQNRELLDALARDSGGIYQSL